MPRGPNRGGGVHYWSTHHDATRSRQPHAGRGDRSEPLPGLQGGRQVPDLPRRRESHLPPRTRRCHRPARRRLAPPAPPPDDLVGRRSHRGPLDGGGRAIRGRPHRRASGVDPRPPGAAAEGARPVPAPRLLGYHVLRPRHHLPQGRSGRPGDRHRVPPARPAEGRETGPARQQAGAVAARRLPGPAGHGVRRRRGERRDRPGGGRAVRRWPAVEDRRPRPAGQTVSQLGTRPPHLPRRRERLHPRERPEEREGPGDEVGGQARAGGSLGRAARGSEGRPRVLDR